jgi:DNA-binding MarR family transcriptional regulator
MRESLKLRLGEASACLNYNLRRTSRQVNHHYDQALQPAGVRAGQFNLMIPVALRGEFSITGLAALLGMERSALARNLKPLERKGWVTVTAGADRRTRLVHLTREGERLLLKAYPLWEKAQRELTAALKGPLLRGLLKGLRAASDAARTED